jgi:hypothetical protein
MKSILLACLFLIAVSSHSQYIGVKARYTETRLVDDSPKPPKRENRLILSFYDVTFNGDYVWTPIVLSNYDIYVYKDGLQYGNQMGGVLDSTGNNYPGYSYPAPKAVAYYNSLGIPYIDCNPNIATHYVVNGQTLDCGFIPVSYHDTDWGTGNAIECFPAPNICLPYYFFGDPYYFNPGNINYDWTPGFPGPPYNMYNFSCGGSLQLVMRGVLGGDSANIGDPLPVRFGEIKGEIDNDGKVTISWSNLTESDIAGYTVEKSDVGFSFLTIGTVIPRKNTGDSANYQFESIQTAERAYYRIKATETSGKTFYSSIIVLTSNRNGVPPADENSSLLVYPNPVTGSEFTFQLSNAEKGRYISSVVNAEGIQLRQKLVMHNGGDLTRSVDLSGLPAGIYQLLLRGERKKYSQTVLYVN